MVCNQRKYCRRVLCAVATVALLGSAGCSKSGAAPYFPGGGPGQEDSGHEVQSDAEIAAVMSAANMGEIKLAEVAQSKAQASEVQSFAAQMIADHTQAEQRQLTLQQQLGLAPDKNEVSRELENESARMLNSLQILSGADFDREYMEGQVVIHLRVLKLLDTQLISKAQNPALQAELQQTRPVIQQHLEKARQIFASLQGAQGSTP